MLFVRYYVISIYLIRMKKRTVLFLRSVTVSANRPSRSATGWCTASGRRRCPSSWTSWKRRQPSSCRTSGRRIQMSRGQCGHQERLWSSLISLLFVINHGSIFFFLLICLDVILSFQIHGPHVGLLPRVRLRPDLGRTAQISPQDQRVQHLWESVREGRGWEAGGQHNSARWEDFSFILISQKNIGF